MNLRCLSLLAGLVALSGCVTATPDYLLSAEPQGKVQNAGQFPIIGREPVAQTTQLTPTQKAELQAELARDAQVAQRQASQNSKSNYLDEVDRLKKLAQERLETLTNRIEGSSEGNGEESMATQ